MLSRSSSVPGPTQNHHVITLASLAKQVETGASAVTSSSDFRRPTNLGPEVEALRAKWGWIVARGLTSARGARSLARRIEAQMAQTLSPRMG